MMTLVGAGLILATTASGVLAGQLAKGNITIGTAAKSTDAEYYAFPSVCRMKNGDLVCVFFNGSGHICPDSKVSMVRSLDEGKTWSTVRTIIDTPKDDRDPSVMQTRTGRLLVNFFTRNTETNASAKDTNHVWVSWSDDGGNSFSPPKQIRTDWEYAAITQFD
jgi:hypothetical protein